MESNQDKKIFYRIAEMPLTLEVPAKFDESRFLPNIEPFKTAATGEKGLTLRAHFGSRYPDAADLGSPLATSFSDIGHSRLYLLGKDTFVVAIDLDSSKTGNYLVMTADSMTADAWLTSETDCAAAVLSSITRIFMAQRAAAFSAVFLHASCVVGSDGKAYLFLGRSGTGKSTHAALWLARDRKARLLNDDNPAMRMMPDGSIRVYGTPWSGKKSCYINESAPAGAIVKLSQARINHARLLNEIESFCTLLGSSNLITSDIHAAGKLHSLLARMAPHVKMAALDCLPDQGAVDAVVGCLKL